MDHNLKLLETAYNRVTRAAVPRLSTVTQSYGDTVLPGFRIAVAEVCPKSSRGNARTRRSPSAASGQSVAGARDTLTRSQYHGPQTWVAHERQSGR